MHDNFHLRGRHVEPVFRPVRISTGDSFEISIDPESLRVSSGIDITDPALSLIFILTAGQSELMLCLTRGKPGPGLRWARGADGRLSLVLRFSGHTLPPCRPSLRILADAPDNPGGRDRMWPREHRFRRSVQVPLDLVIEDPYLRHQFPNHKSSFL